MQTTRRTVRGTNRAACVIILRVKHVQNKKSVLRTLKTRGAAVRHYLGEGVWAEDVDAQPVFRRLGVNALRFLLKTLGGFAGHRCGLHAAGLTYFSMLALVPVLCLLLLLARTCGVGEFARDRVNASIDSFITTVEKGQESTPKFLIEGVPPEIQQQKRAAAKDFALQARGLANELFDKIEQFNVGTLGLVGLLMLVWTVVSTFGMVEVSLNELWEIPRARPLWKKFFLYVFVAIVLPLLVTLAMSMPILQTAKRVLDATLGATVYTKWVGDALIALLDSSLFSFVFTYFFSSLAFAFVLWFIPNRRVPFRSAFKAGVATALLQGVWLNVCAVAQVGIASSSALYGSFALLPILLAWIYMSWQIVLLGGSMSYAFECVHRRVRDLPCE